MKKFSFLILFVSAISFAQSLDSIQHLEEVVVTGTKYPIAKRNSGKIVAKISHEDLKLNPNKSVAQLLNEIAGVEILGSRSMAGKNQATYIQGGKAGQVLVIVDGIPVIDPSGIDMSYDLNMLTSSQIESIEILRGAAGTLYGSGAATAVINIKTVDSGLKSLNIETGATFATQRDQESSILHGKNWNQFVNVSGKKDAFSYLVSFTNANAKGSSEAYSTTEEFKQNPFEKQSALLKFGFKPNQKWNFQMLGTYVAQYHQFDADAFADSEVNKSNSDEMKIALTSLYKHQKGQLHWITEFKNANRNYKQFSDWTMTLDEYVYKTNSIQSDMYHLLNVKKHLDILTGVNYQFHNTDNTTPWGNIEKKLGNFNTLDSYINLNVKELAGFNITLGGRMNVHNIYGSHFTYAFNPSYVLDLKNANYLKIIGSMSSAYLVPSLYQLFSVYGNQQLQPEITKTLEAGLVFNLDNKIEINALYFDRDEENSIIFYTNPDTWASQYRNDKESVLKVSGVETGLSVKPFTALKINTNYTFTNASKERPYSIPKHKWNTNLTYNLMKNSTLQIKHQYLSDRTQMDFTSYPYTTKTLKNFHLMGIGWSQNVWHDQVNVHVAIDNIFNTDYVESIGYTTMGRNFALSFSYKI